MLYLATMLTKKKEKFTVPGTVIKCASGRFLAYYEHRTDIIANGDSEREAKANLKKLYDVVKKNEQQEQPPIPLKLPPHTSKKYFSEKLSTV